PRSATQPVPLFTLPPTTDIYTLSLHDALPIFPRPELQDPPPRPEEPPDPALGRGPSRLRPASVGRPDCGGASARGTSNAWTKTRPSGRGSCCWRNSSVPPSWHHPRNCPSS